jgi:hypothetical protein
VGRKGDIFYVYAAAGPWAAATLLFRIQPSKQTNKNQVVGGKCLFLVSFCDIFRKKEREGKKEEN